MERRPRPTRRARPPNVFRSPSRTLPPPGLPDSREYPLAAYERRAAAPRSRPCSRRVTTSRWIARRTITITAQSANPIVSPFLLLRPLARWLDPSTVNPVNIIRCRRGKGEDRVPGYGRVHPQKKRAGADWGDQPAPARRRTAPGVWGAAPASVPPRLRRIRRCGADPSLPYGGSQPAGRPSLQPARCGQRARNPSRTGPPSHARNTRKYKPHATKSARTRRLAGSIHQVYYSRP